MATKMYPRPVLDAVTALAALAHADQSDAEQVTARELAFVEHMNAQSFTIDTVEAAMKDRACPTCEAPEPQDFGHFYTHTDPYGE